MVGKKRYVVIILILIATVLLYNFVLGSYATDTLDEETIRSMLIDTANAYYRKGELYQYDQYRENIFMSPESINEYNPLFGTCSSFVYQVYYSTLGIKINLITENHILRARKNNDNNNNPYVRYYTTTKPMMSITYYENGDDDNAAYIESYPNSNLDNINLDQMVNNGLQFLEKGDIVAVGFGDNGHTGMVYEVTGETIKIIDNNGQVYDYDNYKEEYEDSTTRVGGNGGSLKISDFSTWLDSFYANDAGRWSGDIAFVKIITDDSDNNQKHYVNHTDSGITSGGLTFNLQDRFKEAKIRTKYKDLDFEKSYEITYDDCSNTKSLYAGLESKIKYTIKITNNSTISYTINNIKEDIDTSMVEYLEATGASSTFSSDKVIFSNIVVAGNTTTTLEYMVKVKNDTGLINSTIISDGKIDDVLPLKNIQIKVGVPLSDYQKNRIITNYENVTSYTTSEDGINYINALYQKVFAVELGLSDGIISYENKPSNLVKNTKINKNNDIIISNLYGLKIADEDSPNNNFVRAFKAWRRISYNTVTSSWGITGNASGYGNISDLGEYVNRTRILVTDMLEIGDVILTNSIMYLYINDDTPKLIKNGQIVMSGDEVTLFLRDLIGDNYVALRPSLSANFPRKVYTITYNYDVTDTVSNMPNPTTYTYSKIDACNTNLSDIIPTRDGYTFNGWMLSTNHDRVFSAGIAWRRSNQANYNLITTWTVNTYTISYDLAGGTADNPANYTIESNTISLTAPTKTGYTFVGWTGDDGNNPQISVTIVSGSTGDKSYTANWVGNTYTVAYDANGGNGLMPNQTDFIYGIEKALNTNTFTRTGYTFVEWNTKSDGTGISYLDGAKVSNLTATSNDTVTLYAQWEEAFAYEFTIDSESVFSDEITVNLSVNKLKSIDLTNLTVALLYDKNKLSLKGYHTINGYNALYDENTMIFTITGSNISNNQNILSLTFKKTAMESGENTNIEFFALVANYDDNLVENKNLSRAIVYSSTGYIKGDMNKNGKIDLDDLICLLKKYLGLEEIDANDVVIGDMDYDNTIGLSDVILLLKLYLGIS